MSNRLILILTGGGGGGLHTNLFFVSNVDMEVIQRTTLNKTK